jgi:VIT1/CCC1 family predicted Fe2+/Mn2+ transporter
VCGDQVKLSLGGVVAADVHLIGGSVELDQSMLTGESLPIDASAGTDTFAGALVRRGEATAIVTATGTRTKFGRTAELVQSAHVVSTQQTAVLNHIADDPDQLLRALASERLGSSEEALSNPLVSAGSGALSTAIGASIPVIPFFFMHGIEAVIAAAIISLAAHFAVGAAKSLITVRSWWSSGVEMTLVGAAEGVVTYGIGILLGKGGI